MTNTQRHLTVLFWLMITEKLFSNVYIDLEDEWVDEGKTESLSDVVNISVMNTRNIFNKTLQREERQIPMVEKVCLMIPFSGNNVIGDGCLDAPIISGQLISSLIELFYYNFGCYLLFVCWGEENKVNETFSKWIFHAFYEKEANLY